MQQFAIFVKKFVDLRRLDNQQKFDALRREFETFTFSSQEVSLHDGELSLTFHFSLDNRYHFHPNLVIPARPYYHWESIPRRQIETLAFHIGMVELVSYWKIACPQKVVVKPFDLMLCQRKWWRHLYYNGLGEFFYLNGITCSEQEMMRIESHTDRAFERIELPLEEKTLIPVGGGKDSVVTLELLRKSMAATPLIMNPRGATIECVETAGYSMDEVAVIHRSLDPTMLQLNREGYLNGHTPFSALLAFVTLLLGFGSGSRYIALSNESSANESTVPGTDINHQYSKSIQFERDFREYVSSHLNDKIQYFSFLRPLNEMQIAWLFSQFESYHKVFKSCNAGSKTDSWCCKCPKCLFTWLILSPFIPRARLIEIFGKDLLTDSELRPVFEELNGTSPVKPFECVGTVEEVRACVDSMKDRAGTIVEDAPRGDASVEEILRRFNGEHFLPEPFVDLLKSKLYV